MRWKRRTPRAARNRSPLTRRNSRTPSAVWRRGIIPANFPRRWITWCSSCPAESLFSAALEGDHDLIVWAAEKRILLATPASLIALLRSVSVSWQQHAQTENAQKIAEAAQELFVRVVTFTEHLEKIRGGLETAEQSL